MALLLLAALLPLSAPASPPTAEAYFAEPQFRAVTVSPDGGHLAALVGREAGAALTVMARGAPRARALPVPAPLRAYHWLTPERLLLTIGAPRQSPGLAAINRDGRDYTVLVPPGPDAARATGVQLVSLLPGEPGHALVALDDRRSHAPDVYRLNAFTGERRRVVANPGRFFRWLADGHGRVRAAMGWQPRPDGIRYGVWRRLAPDGRWQRIREFVPGGESVVPLGFDASGLVVAASAGRDTAAIRRMDEVTGKLGEMLYARPDVDVTRFVPGPGGVSLVRWEDQRPAAAALDETQRRRQDWLDERLPGMVHRQVSASRNGQFAIIHAWSDRIAGRYYLLDRGERTLEPVGAQRPWLDSVPRRSAIRFRAGDGWALQGYLTRPAGEPGAEPPLLVMPHGGPWSRDHWGFDAAAQFFARHGWAVLQVNFRGSTGFGRAHLNAGRRQWDGVMLSDLADGARWVAAQGLADGSRVCVMGASFGGYAALMSAIRYPSLYRCAVSYAAVTDLAGRIRQLRRDGDGRAYHEWRDMVGDPERGLAGLVDASPLNHARAMETPILLGHGLHDRRVAPAQSRRLAEAMTRAGGNVETLWLPGEGHGIDSPGARARFHERALAFINAHVER